MQIVNGRWVDNNNNPIDDFNFTQFKEISENVTSIYGKDITHERISLISSLKALNSEQESLVADLLKDHKTISKLAGY
jgi:hypothetical protein